MIRPEFSSYAAARLGNRLSRKPTAEEVARVESAVFKVSGSPHEVLDSAHHLGMMDGFLDESLDSAAQERWAGISQDPAKTQQRIESWERQIEPEDRRRVDQALEQPREELGFALSPGEMHHFGGEINGMEGVWLIPLHRRAETEQERQAFGHRVNTPSASLFYDSTTGDGYLMRH